MMIMNQDLPLLHRLPVAGSLSALAIPYLCLRPRPAIGKRPGIGRIAQELMDATLAWQPPHDFLPCCPGHNLREPNLLIPKPQQRLPSRSQLAELVEDELEGLLDLAIGGLIDLICVGADKADRDFPHDTAFLHFLFERRASALAEEPQFKLTNRAFKAQD
jgi:hypothetical protein